MFIVNNWVEYTMLAVAFLCTLAFQQKSPEVVDEKLFAQHRLRVGDKSPANTVRVTKLSQESFDKGVKFYKKAKITDRVFFVNNPIARAVEKLPSGSNIGFAMAASFITLFMWMIVTLIFLVPANSHVFLFPLFISTLALTAFLTVAIFLDLPTKYRILAKQHLSGCEINCEQINCEQGTGTLFSFYKEHTDYNGDISKDLKELVFKEEDVAVISLLSSMCELASIDCSESTRWSLRKKLDARLFDHLESFDAKRQEEQNVRKESNDNIAQAVVESALETDDMLR